MHRPRCSANPPRIRRSTGPSTRSRSSLMTATGDYPPLGSAAYGPELVFCPLPRSMPRGKISGNRLGGRTGRTGCVTEGRTVPVTQGDVARRAGVSARTVSNVVNEFPLVSDELRQRVLRAISELGYQPNLV